MKNTPLFPLVWIAAVLVAIALPFVGLYPVLLMKILCFGLYACAFNLLLGYTGLLSFGHAAFYGVAAYTTGYLLKTIGLPPLASWAAGTFAAGLLGLLFGWLAIRRSGIYFAMITLALSQMVYFVVLQAPASGGEDGLQGLPRGSVLGLDLSNDLTLYFVVLAVFVAAFGLIWRIVHSPFGQLLTAIRENEPRALSLGYDVGNYKLLAFTLSAALAGLAGSMKATVLGFATLTDVLWSTSGAAIFMVLVGGIGTLTGPLVGALVIILLETGIGDAGNWLATMTGVRWFTTLGESVSLVTGLIFMLFVLALRRGIVGTAVDAWNSWRQRSRALPAGVPEQREKVTGHSGR